MLNLGKLSYFSTLFELCKLTINTLLSRTAHRFLLAVVRCGVEGSVRDTLTELKKATEILPGGTSMPSAHHTLLYTELPVGQ